MTPPSVDEIEQQVRLFLKESAPGKGQAIARLGRDEWLWNVIDSLSLLDLVEYLEKTFGIVIEPLDLIPENFGSIERIIAFICSGRGG